MKIFAPGKLILSGEHAVVYGKPALAMAVNRYVVTSLTDNETDGILFDLKELSYQGSMTFAVLKALTHQIKENYRHYTEGHGAIREVLHQPFQLAQYALGLCLELLNIKSDRGMQVRINSTIPMGCGMGSSAATIVSMIYAVMHYAGMQVSPETLYEIALQAENMQHGRSSGLDLYVSLYGGCCYAYHNLKLARAMPTIPMYLVNTGYPETSTGECVAAVATYFKDSAIGDAFSDVTDAMDVALQQNAVNDFKLTINANHELLNNIGVVPLKVRHFIDTIKSMGGVAKVCGAGAVAGDCAGMVMAVMEDDIAFQVLCKKYGYTILSVHGEERGAHVVL